MAAVLEPVSSNLRRPPSPGLPHGKFLPWIADEFEMSDRTANDFMNVAHRFGGKSAIIADLKPTILYALSAPSTPESVVEKAIEKAEADGVRITAPPYGFQITPPETRNPDRRMADRGFYLRLAQYKLELRTARKTVVLPRTYLPYSLLQPH